MLFEGFVDLQVNGFAGIDFAKTDLTPSSFKVACSALRRAGTAAFFPTVVTASLDVYQHVLPILASACEEDPDMVLGIHLEGPFISPEPGAVGVHNPSLVLPPSIEFFTNLLSLARGHIKILTLAAELPGAVELTRHAVSKNVVVALGHQLASPTDLANLVSAGATMLTHFGNGMPNLVHRHNNILMAGMAEDNLVATLITDGHHLPGIVIKSVVRAKGLERVCVVSDCTHIAGLTPGQHTFMGRDVTLEPTGKLHDPERQCLAGSASTMLQCANHLLSLGILEPAEVVAACTTSPLRFALGKIDRIDLSGPGKNRPSPETPFVRLRQTGNSAVLELVDSV